MTADFCCYWLSCTYGYPCKHIQLVHHGHDTDVVAKNVKQTTVYECVVLLLALVGNQAGMKREDQYE